MVYSTMSIHNMELKNRWIMLAMHMGFSQENSVSERELAFYEARAKGGVAAVTLVIGVNGAGRLRNMLDASKNMDWDSVKKLSDIVHQYDCKLIVQLFHCGRNESQEGHEGRPLLAPSPIPSPIHKQTPVEMTQEMLADTVRDYAFAAEKCKEYGVDAIEINAATGYLLSQFFSPIDNMRKDAYGGSLENRMAYPLEVIGAVRKEVGLDYPLFVKISGAQMTKDGYTVADMTAFAQKIEKEKLADAITVTGGWMESPIQQISYHVPLGGYGFLADTIKRAVSLKVVACNRIHDLDTAETLLEKGVCDFVGSARGFLCDAEFANRMLEAEPYNICQGCNKCVQLAVRSQPVCCAYNPEAGNEYIERTHRRVATMKKVLVIGGGPGGMMAAKKAAERGYKTTLVTMEDRLGGQLNLAMLPPGKQELYFYIKYMEHELQKLNVSIIYNTKADAEFVLNHKPYFVVVAVGSKPVKPNIPGIDMPHVHMSKTVFLGDGHLFSKFKKGATVIIGGGSLGLEIAEFLWDKVKVSDASHHFMKAYFGESIHATVPPLDIQILEKCPVLGIELGGMSKPVIEQLEQQHVKMETEVEVTEIQKDAVIAVRNGVSLRYPADNVVIALGSEPADTSFVSCLEDERISYAIIGDADAVGDAKMAIFSAYDLFLRMYLA